MYQRSSAVSWKIHIKLLKQFCKLAYCFETQRPTLMLMLMLMLNAHQCASTPSMLTITAASDPIVDQKANTRQPASLRSQRPTSHQTARTTQSYVPKISIEHPFNRTPLNYPPR